MESKDKKKSSSLSSENFIRNGNLKGYHPLTADDFLAEAAALANETSPALPSSEDDISGRRCLVIHADQLLCLI